MRNIARFGLFLLLVTEVGLLLAASRDAPAHTPGSGGAAATTVDCEGIYAYSNRVILDFSRLGKPAGDWAVKSFNGRFREECLSVHWFASMQDAPNRTDTPTSTADSTS